MNMFSLEKESLLPGFLDQNTGMQKFLKENQRIRIGTLGPIGTTSSGAAEFYITNVNKIYKRKLELKLWNDFNLVYEGLLEGEVDLIIIPNPYEEVAKIYWDSDLELIFSFILDSPYYGLAAKNQSFTSKKNLLIATGPGVHSLIKRLGSELLRTHTFDLYNVNSTTEAAIAVHEGRADLAVTNDTSLDKTGLDFVTPIINTKILWSVFKRKKK